MASTTPENQGSDIPANGTTRGRLKGAAAKAGISVDATALDPLVKKLDDIKTSLKDLKKASDEAVTSVNKLGATGVTSGASKSTATKIETSGVSGGSVKASMAGSLGSMATRLGFTKGGGGGGGVPGGGTGGGGGGGLGKDLVQLNSAIMKPIGDFSNALSQRISQGAEYSLQADRMTTMLQQMYGMSNKGVRQTLRMPLTNHYLLGGGTAINDLLGMQASTGLNAAKQASSVEAIRAVSGFSYGSGDVTRMLSSMASPDVANKMFMMGGTGMYKIGGGQRTGMQTIQDIVKRTGLTNPDALKGALQQGSNTRQRLTAMGVPADMQDMVIQYAMQNSQYQRKTGSKGMYDPSLEGDRKTMGIEETYAVAHEKTTGERIKREEKFYDKQTGAFAQFEKNLRLTTSTLSKFENAMSGLIKLRIGMSGHPVTNTLGYLNNYGQQVGQAAMQTAIDAAETAAELGGDPVDGLSSRPSVFKGGDASDGKTKLSKENERKLAQLDPKLATPLRNMLAANSKLYIGDARRSSAQQERSFKERYIKTDAPLSEKGENDRIWNGALWKIKPGEVPMAPPGQSFHEKGLAADVAGDPEWVRANSAKYGLDNGGTRKGAQSDEPFHVQPAGTIGSMPSDSSSGGTVSKASVTSSRQSMGTTVNNRSIASSTSTQNLGLTAAEYSRIGGTAMQSSIIRGIDKPISLGSSAAAQGGDPVDRYPRSMGGGGTMITVPVTVHINGSSDMTSDVRRLAQEVSRIMEHEVKLMMMRSN